MNHSKSAVYSPDRALPEAAAPAPGPPTLTHTDDQMLKSFIKDRQTQKVLTDGSVEKSVTNQTINIAIERAVRVLTLGVRKWRDDDRPL